jgi:sterol desaturase/sphingolipid hydroxylase (fatty acid hydroxylase superfamily)
MFREQLLLLIETPIYALLILGEMLLSSINKTNSYSTKDTLTNLMCTSLNLGLDVLMRGFTLGALAFAFQFAPVSISNPFLYWFLLFIGQDFLYYLLHLVDHYSRFFWAVHVTHHSSEKFNFTVAIRSSVFQPLYRFIYYMPLAFMGFKPLDILFMYAICQTYGFFVHTEKIKKMGFLEWFLVTPSHHRVHHASNPIYLDKNMGMVLIIWDKIFGTFQEETEKPYYGLTTPLKTGSPREVIFGEWEKLVADLKRPIPWSLKWKYIWNPPGWSHDKTTLTSNEIRQKLHLNKNNQEHILS